MTGHRAPSGARNTSARSTRPSSMGIGTSQSTRMPSRSSLLKSPIASSERGIGVPPEHDLAVDVLECEIERQPDDREHEDEREHHRDVELEIVGLDEQADPVIGADEFAHDR